MWELDYKEKWVLKNWCFWTVVLEKTLESPLDCQEIKPVHPKGNQSSCIFIGRTDAEAETPILCPPDVKNWLIWKDPDAGQGWRWKEKGMKRMRWLDASLTLWTWIWVNSGSWWRTGKIGVLQSLGSQRVGHDSGTELNWVENAIKKAIFGASLGGPLVKLCASTAEDTGFVHGWGTKIAYASRCSQKVKKTAKIWVLGVFIAIEVLLLLGLPGGWN